MSKRWRTFKTVFVTRAVIADNKLRKTGTTFATLLVITSHEGNFKKRNWKKKSQEQAVLIDDGNVGQVLSS